MTVIRDTALVIFGIGVGIVCERTFLKGSSRKVCIADPKKKRPTRETATQTSKAIHFQTSTEFMRKLRKEKEQSLQRFLRLLEENKALQWERDACLAREATVTRERDLAIRAKDDAQSIIVKAIRDKDDALRATAEAVRSRDGALQREERANNTIALVTCARDDAIQSTNAAVGEKNHAIREKRKALRAVKELILSRDLAIIDRDVAIGDRDRVKCEAVRVVQELTVARDVAIRERDVAIRDRDEIRREAARAVREATLSRNLAIIQRDGAVRCERLALEARDEARRAEDEAIEEGEKASRKLYQVIEEQKEHTICVVKKITGEKVDAIIARNQALSTVEALRRALRERMTEIVYMRRMMGTTAPLPSITMNPPQ